MRWWPLLALIAAPAAAAERSVAVVNFDRIRIDGPFEVRLTTDAEPNASLSGSADVLDKVELRVEGTTLIVRAGNAGWGERPRAKAAGAPLIRVSTRSLRSAGVVGGGVLTIVGPVRGDRIDLTVTGAGSIAASGLAANELVATLIGTGEIALGGTARSARLLSNGAGRIAARDLTANDVTIRTDGATEVAVGARYTASATSTGLGAITVLGSPECKVKAAAGGPIACGREVRR
ncbi:MAG: head GIN domain-containing protein [Pseudomonadota bacterium]